MTAARYLARGDVAQDSVVTDFAKMLSDRLGYRVAGVLEHTGRCEFHTAWWPRAGVVLALSPQELAREMVAACPAVADIIARCRRLTAGGAEEPTPILFLDFDGVLNPGWPPHDSRMVAALNRITATARARIVVHSSWRYTLSLDELRAELATMGVTGEVIGVCDTPKHVVMPDLFNRIIITGVDLAEWEHGCPSTPERAVAIWRWLRDHPEHDPGGRFAILDDDESLGHYVGTPHFIQTNTDHDLDGLTEAHADAALAALGRAGQ